ncbi:glutathione-disulfide reductase [Variovorax sp.]|uniref:glutathione-disulfide reductase n=1 Tax=Variovorax sp. TaxID=1871043 RepID=UPI002D6D186C|nr:glutathione-disulfide reductase [Variovorax sp.]HYP83552.1 glutathione-disulfide reductase [Variovorax sp.]
MDKKATKQQPEELDLFVIGGGSGGVRAARMAAGRGARVALAEMGELGGTCVNVGCIPKKLYSYAAGYAEAFEEAAGYGWDLGQAPRLDWGRLKAARAQEIHRLNGIYQSLLEGPGVEIIRDRATMVDAHTVAAGGRHWRAKHVLIATGGRPFKPPVPGHELALVSDDMFDLDPFPKRLVVVGAGYIACEMASIFNGLGAQVTLLQRGAHMLGAFDEDVRSFVAAEMGKTGVDIRLSTQITSMRRGNGGLNLMLDRGQDLQADAVLMATGRVANTDDLGLEAAGVKLSDRGAVVVDAQFRSSVPHIFAVGDASSRLHLTPVALAEAMVVVDMLFPEAGRSPRQAPDYDFVPTAVFTHPNIGTCGYTEAQARAQLGNDNVSVYCTEFKPLRHTLSGRSERTFMKLLVAKDSDRVVGLHMVGADAGEIVQGFAVAMQAGATKAHFDRTIGIHPTAAEEFVTMRVPNVG